MCKKGGEEETACQNTESDLIKSEFPEITNKQWQPKIETSKFIGRIF